MQTTDGRTPTGTVHGMAVNSDPDLRVAHALRVRGLTDTPELAQAVSTSIVVTVTVAASFGMMVPFTFHRLGVDPAIATGPFVTTGIDVVAILIYFATCKTMLGL